MLSCTGVRARPRARARVRWRACGCGCACAYVSEAEVAKFLSEAEVAKFCPSDPRAHTCVEVCMRRRHKVCYLSILLCKDPADMRSAPKGIAGWRRLSVNP